MKHIIALAMVIVVFTICCFSHPNGVPQHFETDTTGIILLNQVGYEPSATKIALIRYQADKFTVIEVKSESIVFTGTIGSPAFWEYSGDTVRTADFSSLTQPGRYRICLPGKKICSYEFSIKKGIYNDITKASIKAFYYNRCSFEITKPFGGKWARPAGHPDTAVIIHESAASVARPAGTVISCPGGWYDAGDYNKYIVNSGITTYTLLLFYQMYPEYCRNLNLYIPESNNTIPDVVDELLVNLKWMLTMQDPADGGVYHKLTNKRFDGFIMPDKATAPRYVVMKTTAAALDFASVMAAASRIFAQEKDPGLLAFSKTCLMAANKAMGWAKAHPATYYVQPKDIQTGEYGNVLLDDEFFWARTETALANNNPSALTVLDIKSQQTIVPSWDTVNMLGLISLSLSENPKFKALRAEASKKIIAYADTLLLKYQTSAYKVSLDFFKWGSNSDVANEVLVQMIALKLSGNKKYLPSIQGGIDYMLGRNATGYCFVSGFGTRMPQFLHHRPSIACKEAVPGFLVGGPTTVARNDCGEEVYRSKFPAKSYLDEYCSYSTNEIAINWNAALFFVLGTMDAMGQ